MGDNAKTAWRPVVGENVRIQRPGFESVQKVLTITRDTAFCTGGWCFIRTPDGWLWDVTARAAVTTRMLPSGDPDIQIVSNAEAPKARA